MLLHRRRWRVYALVLVAILLPLSLNAQKPVTKVKGPGRKPAPAASRFTAVDAIVEQAIEDKKIPGAVVLIGHNGRVVLRKAYGWRSLEPARERMTPDTIFDVASLTKCVATTTSIMRMVQLGQVRLNEPVATYIPEFGVKGKEQITVRQLLTHFSGLREDLDLKQQWHGKEAAYRMAHDETPIYPPGSRFLYSDINFEVLGELVERVSGMPLDKYASVHVFQPLKMTHTSFNPPFAWNRRIAPTEYDESGRMLRGEVHDPTARRMGGVAGHAGLFSTADDLARFARALLAGGTPVLSPLIVEKMTTPQQPPIATQVRGLGWDIDSPFSSNRGDLLPVGSFGHTGFTGTSLWIDPTTNTYIILLANGVHPRGQGSLVSLRNRLATAVAAVLDLKPSQKQKLRLARITGYNETYSAPRRIPFRNGQVKTGIDVLEAREFQPLLRIADSPRLTSGKKPRIGLVTNHTGVDAQGRRTIDVLASAPGLELAAIFAPEHGVLGELDTTEIGNTVDRATGVPVYSVYGDTDAKRRPSLQVLEALDAVVYDIQDAGARFYTYETTLGYFLEAAAQAGIPIVVLDRPNPVTGSFVQGPISDPGTQSFVNYHPVPVRHGMTIGELAQMFNAERNIKAKLAVVPMEGWIRGDWFDSTGLLWIHPSPNLRSLTAATLYPGVCLIEGTNVSVGRGTDTPFEVVGAPWIKAEELAAYLNARSIQGVRFVPEYFTPRSDKYQGERLGGVNIVLLDRNSFDAPELGVELAAALLKLYPNQFDTSRMNRLVNNKAVMDALVAGIDPRRIAENWRESVDRFVELRKKYLLY